MSYHFVDIDRRSPTGDSVPVRKSKHGRTITDLLKQADTPPPSEGASMKEQMIHDSVALLSHEEDKAADH